jgi:hypothetical protein
MNRRLVSSLSVLLASTVMDAAAEEDERRVDYTALPGVSFSSDLGTGLGLSAAAFVRDPGWSPYRFAARLNLFATTKGVQDHALVLDAPDLGGSGWRPVVMGGYHRDRFRPFHGIGNQSSLTTDPGERAFDISSPFLLVMAEKRIGGEWFVGASYDLRGLRMTVDPASRLGRERPTGTAGGRHGRLDVYARFDTRDVEASPTNGVYLEASAHGAGSWLGSDFASGGVSTDLRAFRSLTGGSGLVLAGRVIADATWGEVPVALLSWFGGRSKPEGLGGAAMLRGLPRLRYLGKGKAAASLELRSEVARLEFADQKIDLWAVGFVDAGRVWAEVAGDGAPWNLHWSRGLGMRFAWAKDFVLRLDLGFSEGTYGVYGALNQAF